MTERAERPERSLFVRWIRATTLGWLLGFVLVVLLALVWDAIGGGAQFMVGVGMGAGVGLVQARVIGHWVEPPRRWLWASTVGMGIPFVAWDLGAMAGVGSFFSMPFCVVAGSLLVGLLQRRLLVPRFERTSWWIPACVAGWGLPAGAMVLGSSGYLQGLLTLLSTLAMFLGGVVLGAVTGRALQSMPQRTVSALAPAGKNNG